VKPRLLEILVCPLCQADLRLTSDDDGEEIIEGRLDCPAGDTFPISGGIPRMVPPDITPDKVDTAKRFGWSWDVFDEMHEEHREQYLDWIWPIEPAFFEDKVVLEGGCGIGRHTECAASFRAREVIAIDLGPAVEIAYRNVGHLPNVHIVQADIYRPPFRIEGGRRDFDFVFSIGVLHHLPDPEAGFASLVRLLKPGASIFGWVYGEENNSVVHYFINPLRKTVTSHLPGRVLLALAWPLALLLQGLVKAVYHPLRTTRIFRFLPSHAYLDSLAAFSFRQNYGIVFDHLTAPTAFYVKGSEFQEWFRRQGLEELEFSWRNENSWRGRGRRSAKAAAAVGQSEGPGA
jgi:SAM-dependent methyltransferase